MDFRALAQALTDPTQERVSMAEVARRLRVAKPTLYRMAGSREELIAISIDAEAERLLEEIHRDGVPGIFRFAGESPAGFALLFGDRYPEARKAVRRVENRLARESSAFVGAGLLGLAAGIARRAIEEGRLDEPERLRSDFDAVVKLASEISDREA
jgi:AcrR family transcriptional regulator